MAERPQEVFRKAVRTPVAQSVSAGTFAKLFWT
jgi:hypothetical protein